MATKRLKPARSRYELGHPVWSARLDSDTFRRLEELRAQEGVSRADLLLRLLEGPRNEEARRAHLRGLAEGLLPLVFEGLPEGVASLAEALSNLRDDRQAWARSRRSGGWHRATCWKD